MRTSTRRGFLALGLGSGAALLVRASAAADPGTVTVGGLAFDLPPGVREASSAAVVGGPTWSWCGTRPAQDGVVVVLARADLASSDPEEVVGWLLAEGLGGALPGLQTESRRSRAMPGGGEQARIDLSYLAGAPARYGGTVLVATRPDGPAGVVAVLGDDRLTAGEVAVVLDSARWVS